MAGPAALSSTLADRLNDALPQTQCTRCGFPDCRSYADAIASSEAQINQCPPGGHEGIVRLAALSGRAALALNPANGVEGPRRRAVIDEGWCIGCTLCLDACPVDCIVGGPKQMHTVIDALCTGCELCIPACPVDCIALVDASGPHTGWDAWSVEQAAAARERFAWHRTRLERNRREHEERLAAHERSDNPGR
jgi:electron transport complex protein RnfB